MCRFAFGNLPVTTSRFEQETVEKLINDIFCAKCQKEGISKAVALSPYMGSLKWVEMLTYTNVLVLPPFRFSKSGLKFFISDNMSEIALALAQELVSSAPVVTEEGKQVLFSYCA